MHDTRSRFFFGPAGNVCELSGLAAMVRRVLTIALVLLSSCVLVACISNFQSHTAPLSLDSAIEPSLSRRLQISPNTARAKNVILFVGDGMGVSTVTASRIFDGQSLGQSGEEHVLSFEQFPHVALVKTYNTNQQVPDSAGTATALLTGTKTRAGVVGIGPAAERRNCSQSLTHELQTIAELAEQRGLATGIVTTARLPHATPAAAYAHVPERDWESDRYVSDADWAQGCRDIAYQLAHFAVGDGLEVVFGGGRREFVNQSVGGERRRADDLIDSWVNSASGRQFITSLEEIRSERTPTQVLGLFADSHMTYMAERRFDTDEPLLSEMTAAALDLLSQSSNGFFLLVEGGRIDHGHHEGRAGYALSEVQEFNHAIEVALAKVDLAETLILVTADHSHVFTIGGYPTRGNPILGLVHGNDLRGNPNVQPELADDGMPYTTLGYQNGPGAVRHSARPAPATGVHAKQQALYPLRATMIDGSDTYDESHGGEDVALYAAGPWAHLVGGVLEQHVVFHIMTYAFGWDR